MEIKIDESRLNFCANLGRRFYVAARIAINYLCSIDRCDWKLIPLTGGYFTPNDGHLLDVHPRYKVLDPILSYKDTIYKCRHMFRNFGRKMDINELIDFDKAVLHYRYDIFDLYRERNFIHEIINKAENIFSKLVPVEVKIDDFIIKFDYPDSYSQLFNGGKVPLVYLLYRSNEAVEFFRKFIALILNTNHIYHGGHIYNEALRLKLSINPSMNWGGDGSKSPFFRSIEKTFRTEYNRRYER